MEGRLGQQTLALLQTHGMASGGGGLGRDKEPSGGTALGTKL